MSFETFIALKYLKSKKSHRFLSFLSFVSLGGIIISVFAFFLVQSVMSGFSHHLEESLVGFNAHVTVSNLQALAHPDDYQKWLSSSKEIQKFSVSEIDGILSTADGGVAGTRARGFAADSVLNDDLLKIYYFGDSSQNDLLGTRDRLPGILIGEDLYSRLHLFPGQESLVTLIYPFGDVGPSGEVEPRQRQFRVIGIFSTGFYDYDTRYVFAEKSEIMRLGKTQTWSADLLRLSSSEKGEGVKKNLSRRFPELKVTTWAEQNKRLFSALALEKTGMMLLLSLITFIASFNVLGLMTLLAAGKTRELALLYALGMTRQQVRHVFWRIGFGLGFLGSVIGLCVGGVVVFLLQRYPLPLPPAYYLQTLPVHLDLVGSFMFVVFTCLVSALAAWWPSLKMSRFNPMQILRVT